MAKRELLDWDIVDYLDSDERMAGYLEAVLEDDDPQLFRAALGDIARARGVSALSRDTGITRPGLYKALSSEGNPSFDTVCKVIDSFGLKLVISTK
ncbi:MAG: putative addiction module antidote protein [Eggerthellaceae bacterium]|jgi:probable addiction module antidote protein|nr:putative addiction module antidote protein [Eggerthellaceae bacterium]MDR2721713.1 putative addiction module antidote protein [Coriobacteriaceae bacterium]